jgi:hypothetical protein
VNMQRRYLPFRASCLTCAVYGDFALKGPISRAANRNFEGIMQTKGGCKTTHIHCCHQWHLLGAFQAVVKLQVMLPANAATNHVTQPPPRAVIRLLQPTRETLTAGSFPAPVCWTEFEARPYFWVGVNCTNTLFSYFGLF